MTICFEFDGMLVERILALMPNAHADLPAVAGIGSMHLLADINKTKGDHESEN